LSSPEKSRGYEFGIEHPFADNKLVLGVTAFRNDIRDFIEIDRKLYLRTMSLPSGGVSVPIQIPKAMTQGFEAALRWEPCKAFGVQGSYTYLDAENQTDAVRLVRRPRHMISSNLWIRPLERLRLGFGLLYTIDREDGFITTQADLEDYMRIRATASFSVSKCCEISARVENLLGERYQEVDGFPAPRTAVYAGLKVKF
jgi:outer membrane cobalamin receptor